MEEFKQEILELLDVTMEYYSFSNSIHASAILYSIKKALLNNEVKDLTKFYKYTLKSIRKEK